MNVEQLCMLIWSKIEDEKFSYVLTLHNEYFLINGIDEVGVDNVFEYVLLNYPERGLDTFLICFGYKLDEISSGKLLKIVRKVLEKERFEGLRALNSFFSGYLNLDMVDLFSLGNISYSKSQKDFVGYARSIKYKLNRSEIAIIEDSGIKFSSFETLSKSIKEKLLNIDDNGNL